MYRVIDKTDNFTVIFYGVDNYEISFWIKNNEIDVNNIIIQDIPNKEYYRETEEDRIINRRDLIIDDLLKGM